MLHTIKRFIILFTLIGLMISCQKRHKTYHDNGKIKELFNTNKQGDKEGKFQQFYDSGQLLEVSNYSDGLLEGKRIFYYENGQIEEIQNYIKGQLNGEQLGYHQNGKLKFKCYNESNKFVGEYFSYYDNGQKRLYLNFVDDLENGPFEEYYSTGVLKWKGTYRNGNKEYGLLEHFDEQGVLIKKMECDTMGICTTVWKKMDIEDQ